MGKSTVCCGYGRASKQVGKRPPVAAIVDAQSVKTTLLKGERGYDAGKRVNGRKRHIIMDMMGLLVLVLVTAANVREFIVGRLLSFAAQL